MVRGDAVRKLTVVAVMAGALAIGPASALGAVQITDQQVVVTDDEGGRALLRGYFEPFIETAARHAAGLIIDTATFRANPDWGAEIGYDRGRLDEINRDAVALAEEVRAAARERGVHAIVSGAVGPRGDGYVPSRLMTAEQAEAYHRVQIATFAQTSADMICAFTLNYIEEAVGIVRAAQAEGLPAAISFTVEVDGRLPDGHTLREAIERVDAETDAGAAYFMVNCAHPTHLAPALADEARGCSASSACARTPRG